MKRWAIKEISNGFVLELPNNQEEFLDTWADIIARLENLEP